MPTIEKRGDSYKITVSCGYDLNGKQIRRHLTWKPEPGMTKRQLQKELDRQAVLFEEKCRNGQVLDGNMVRGVRGKAAAANDHCGVSVGTQTHTACNRTYPAG